jgi:hypothetical protein
MGVQIEWDSRKAGSNERKHGVSFEEASTVFDDPLSLTIPDPEHSLLEDRYVTIGTSARNRILVVVHSDQGDNIRIIGARRATRRERHSYEEES